MLLQVKFVVDVVVVVVVADVDVVVVEGERWVVGLD